MPAAIRVATDIVLILAVAIVALASAGPCFLSSPGGSYWWNGTTAIFLITGFLVVAFFSSSLLVDAIEPVWRIVAHPQPVLADALVEARYALIEAATEVNNRLRWDPSANVEPILVRLDELRHLISCTAGPAILAVQG